MYLGTVSDRTSKIIAIGLVLTFVAFTQVSALVTPDYYSFDSTSMVDIAEGIIGDADGSFTVIARLISIFSLPGLTLIVEAAGCCIIVYLINGRRLMSNLCLAAFSLAVTVPLSLVRPQKEILVLLLTALCVYCVNRAQKPIWALCLTVGLYSLYTAFSWRPYYVLITALIPALYLFDRLSTRNRVILLVTAGLGGFLIPSSVFELVRLTRDAVNELRVLYPEIEGNRTAFSNPMETASWGAFLYNYAYATIRLNIPILFSITPNEIVLTLFSSSWFYLMWNAYKTVDWRARFVVRLILAHLLVLWIFEPDLGSYLRHFSSCILYLAPLFRAIEEHPVKTQANRTGEIVAVPV